MKTSVQRLAAKPTRAGIDRMQAVMATMPQLDMAQNTRHYFADGNRLYCRELFRQEDTTIVGKVHRHEHLYIILSGEVTVSGEGYRERMQAPRIIISQPGVKRAVYAHVDSVCITVHLNPTGSTDLDAIERELIEPDDTALFDARNERRQEVLS